MKLKMRRPRSCSLFPLIYPLIFVISGLGGQSSSFSMTMTTTTKTTTGGPDAPEAEARGAERCSFPGRWEGNWFQSGVHQTITISRYTINIKGRCLEADGEKYLVQNERDHCYRCVVFHEKHQNVLQYKETFCIPERRSLKDMCTTITGDANLFSLFRMEPVPIECPFRGPFTFTYNRGHGECRYPLSTIESCIHPSRLILNYQACPDVPGTESTMEELQCLATWKEGSSRYLLGLIQYRHHSSFEERYRCFVYEKTKKGIAIGVDMGQISQYSNNTNSDNVMFRVAQSGDATCNGLTPLEGSRTMTLRKAVFPKPICNFPSWLQLHAQWHTLDLRSTFAFEGSGLRVSNSSDLSGFNSNTLVMSATCSQILENPTLDKVMLILYTVSECRSGYTCMDIHRRDGHIVELQMGNLGRRAEDACHVSHFNQTQLPYITLVSSTPETRQCPYLGRFHVTGLSRDGRKISKGCSGGFTKLQIGCNQLDTFQLRSECSRTDVISEFACHGWWEEMGVSYLITSPLSRASTGARRYCFVFRESTTDTDQLRLMMKKRRSRAEMLKLKESGLFSLMEDAVEGDHDDEDGYGRVLQFSSIADSCRRHIKPGIEGHLAFNVSSEGQCNDVSGSSRLISQCPIITSLLSFIVSVSIAKLWPEKMATKLLSLSAQ